MTEHCAGEYGAESGLPVIFFHGGNDSRLVGRLLDATAIQTGVRLICPDRPGFGRSTFQPGRRLIDWPSDVEQLADHPGLGHFGAIGHSGGGPHALACAAALTEPRHLRGVRDHGVDALVSCEHHTWLNPYREQ